MAKGSIAKENLMKQFIDSNKENFIGEFDKKYYFWSIENGEQVQIAISLTCPKNPILVDKDIDVSGGDFDFSEDSSAETKVAVKNAPPAEITQEEQDNIAALMEKLGL